MVIWSSFLLDELAGLRNDALPTCPQCKKDPQWLAKNTGILTQMQGPSGPNPAAWGEVVSWNILKDASPKTKDFVTYMMSDGYLPWLEIAPEGKMPARSGTSANPKEYADGWIKLTAGVDKKEPLTEIYPAEVLNTIVASSGNFERWGIPQGQGELAAAVANQYVVPQALAKMLNSGASAADAANQAQQGAEQVKKDLGG
jgi:multiple sugar transport system substrate-binding protein